MASSMVGPGGGLVGPGGGLVGPSGIARVVSQIIHGLRKVLTPRSRL